MLNFVDLLWRVFATGLIATVTSLALRLIEFLLNDTKLTTHIIFMDLIYMINLGLMVGFPDDGIQRMETTDTLPKIKVAASAVGIL